MQDKELYQQILGLCSPWTVADVQLDHEAQVLRLLPTKDGSRKFGLFIESTAERQS